MKEILKFLKLMIVTGLSGGFAFIGFALYRGYDEGRIWAPAPPPTPAQQATAEFNAQVWALVWVAVVVLFLAAVALAVVRFLYVPALNARERIPYDPATGLAPVVRRNVAPFWQRMIGHNEYDEFDPNLSTAPHRKVYSNGTMRVTSQSDGLDPHAQADYARGSWAVQNTVARKGRGASVGESRLLSGEAAAKAELARMKLEAARAKLADKQVVEPLKLLPEVKQLTVSDSLNQTLDLWKRSGEQVATLGQASGGALATWTPRMASVVAIVGANGTGKSSNAGASCVASMVMWGWHVVALEPAEKSDWLKFKSHIQRVPVDGRNYTNVLSGLMEEFDRRAALNAQYQVSHADELPEALRPPKLGVLLEEFGYMYRKCSTSRLENDLDNLFSMARFTNMHFVVIDQRPKSWPDGMKGNVKQVIGYKLAMSQGQSVELYNLGKIAPQGEFKTDMDGEENTYKSWHVLGMADAIAAKVRPTNHKPVPFDTSSKQFAVSSAVVPSGGRGTINGTSSPVVGTVEPMELPPPIDTKMGGVFNGNWDEFAQEFLDQYPDATVSDLYKAMAKVANDGRPPANFKGHASRLFKRYSVNAGDGDE